MTIAPVMWKPLLVALLPAVFGHPLGPKNFDRAIQVVLLPDAIVVEYELGISELTLATELLALVEPGEVPADPAGAIRLYQEKMHPIIGRGLVLTIDGKEQPLVPKAVTTELRDHVRYTFAYRAQPPPADGPRVLTLHDTNFTIERGFRRMALKGRFGVEVLESTQPAIIARIPLVPTWEMTPEEEDASRFVRARWQVPSALAAVRTPAPAEPNRAVDADRRPALALATEASGSMTTVEVSPPLASTESQSTLPPNSWAALAAAFGATQSGGEFRLRELLEQPSGGALWAGVLLIAFVLGMAHAVKPGHGKTMVAAYLVGEQGTLYHAMVLGLVTTMTHTGSVLMVALILRSFAGTQLADSGALSFWLTLTSGVLIAAFGAILLYRRLAGKGDLLHVHGPGGHVHSPDGSVQWLDTGGGHEHVPHTHSHDRESHRHRHGQAPDNSVRMGSLVTLGFSGGLVPCDDAVLLLVAAIGAGLLEQAVYILLAFSAGLAAVLVGIGVLVVKIKGFATRGRAAGRWAFRLQILSATLITLLGLGVCWQAFLIASS